MKRVVWLSVIALASAVVAAQQTRLTLTLTERLPRVQDLRIK
jgi:hypothetical protein